MESSSRYWQSCVQYAALSDRGLRRANNQDSYATVPAASEDHWRSRGHLFLVADGMGAHAAGEMASKMASEWIPLTYDKRRELSPPEALTTAIEEANRQINIRGNANRDFQGMGTTTSTLVVLPEGVLIGHVGDSRIYRLRGDQLEQMTSDHSLSWEVRAAGEHVSAFISERFPNGVPKNIITRSLGPSPDVQVDLEGPIPTLPGDTFLMCSDGLSGPVHDPEIATILSLFPPKEAAQTLVDLANLRGGPDNITLIVIRIEESIDTAMADTVEGTESTEETKIPENNPPLPPQPISKTPWLVGGTISILALILGLFIGSITPMGWVGGVVTTALGTVLGMVVSMVMRWRMTPPPPPPPWYQTLRGHGPYTRTELAYSTEFIQKLAKLTLQLREASEASGWIIDWEKFRVHYEAAVAASNRNHNRKAISELCDAMRFLMERLRTGHPDKPLEN
ncbi:MAG: protein phosphatase 2C domain-containing protein [Thermoguttaceae bacterium]|nr:protein phosphatase 2C domain-containing protein [Thermoguttaceae bacterium]